MRRFLQIGLVCGLVTGPWLGCSLPRAGRVECVTDSASVADQLPQAERAELAVDWAHLGIPAAPPVAAASYYALSAADCQCRAAQASSIARLLELERSGYLRSRKGTAHGAACVESVHADILRSAAIEARNASSSAALELYFRIAEGESQRDLSRRGLAELDAALADVARLRAQGLTVPTDESQLARERMDQADRGLGIEESLARGNLRLISLLGFRNEPPSTRIWPTDGLNLAGLTAIDVEAEVARGLATRDELRLLRRLARIDDPRALDELRSMLGQVAAPLGVGWTTCKAPLFGWLQGLAARRLETEQLRREIAVYAGHREAEIAVEIRQAALTAAARLAQVGVARDVVLSWEARLSDLQARATTGGASFVEITRARLEWIAAQSAAVHSVIDWRVAVVKLKESQGVLAEECQFTACCVGL